VLLVALYTLQQRAYGALGWLTLALVPIAGWSALNLWADGEVHLVYLWQSVGAARRWGAKLLPGVVGLGASTLLWLGVRRRFKAALGDGWRWKVALLALAAAGVVGWYHLQFAGQPMYLQSLLWLVAGVIVLGLAFVALTPSIPLSRAAGEGEPNSPLPLRARVGRGQGVRATPLSHFVREGQGVRATPLSHPVGEG
jgi:hypothetical protein